MEEIKEKSDDIQKGKTLVLVILALIGLALSVKLTMIYFTVNFIPNALPSFCAINDVIDCDGVAQTTFAQVMGIPLALYGVCLYLFVLFLCFVDKLQNMKFLSFLKVFKNKIAYIQALYTISFIISMYLTFVQFYQIHKFCLLCFMTYIVDLISLLVAKDYKKPIYYEFKVSILDFWEGVKIKSNLVALLILALFGTGVLCYAKTSYILTPHIKKIDSLNHYRNMKGNPFKIYGNFLGNPDGDVEIYEYSDFECPMCPIMNRMLQKASKDYKNIYVLHYNYPLDMDCNPIITRPFHQNSCRYARYAIAAKKQGKYWEMINLLFSYQPQDKNDMYKLTKKAGIDFIQLANDYISNETAEELNHEISTGINKKIDGTPTIFINGEKYMGIMSYDELQEVLEKHGAVLNKK